MVTEIRGPTQGGLSQIIQVARATPGALNKAAPATSGIEEITNAAKQEIVKPVQAIDPNLGTRLNVLANYLLPIMYVVYSANQFYNNIS